jgi:hypothetical protein
LRATARIHAHGTLAAFVQERRPMSRFGGRAGWLALGSWIFCGVGLTAVTAFEMKALWLAPPTPPEVVRDVTVRRVADQRGRQGSFRILLFSDEFRWRIASYQTIEDGGAAAPRFSDDMKKVLDSAVEIICVGASSEELPSGVGFRQGRAQEEWRAARRADRIAQWVRESLTKPVPVRKLNIGHHSPTRSARNTSDQRRVVVILVLEKDPDLNLDESLRTAMMEEAERAPLFDSLLTDYSLGAGKEFTWVP